MERVALTVPKPQEAASEAPPSLASESKPWQQMLRGHRRISGICNCNLEFEAVFNGVQRDASCTLARLLWMPTLLTFESLDMLPAHCVSAIRAAFVSCAVARQSIHGLADHNAAEDVMIVEGLSRHCSFSGHDLTWLFQ